jgi:hypothetical protein
VIVHVLLVVSRRAPGLLARLSKEFAGVAVISDRRLTGDAAQAARSSTRSSAPAATGSPSR